MTEIRTPRTPLHPAPNEEVAQLPTVPMADDMDLNPDLYDEDDVRVDIGRGNTIVAEDANISSLLENQEPSNGNTTNNNNNNNNINGHSISGNEEAENLFDSELEDVDLRNGDEEAIEVDLLTPDFEVYMDQIQTQFEANKERQLSASQQSNLVMYLDDSILKIHRKFIKSQVNEEITYPILDLIYDLTSTMNVLWLSVNSRNKLLFQGEYLIKILGDLLDFIENYRHLVDPQHQPNLQTLTQSLQKCFIFFQSLDARISFLMDGYTLEELDSIQKLSRTQIVRLIPIATRLRMAIISKLEPIRRHLGDSTDNHTTSIVVDIEVSKLFEGILDRS